MVKNCKIIVRFGYTMTIAQASLLFEELAENILVRYNNGEYWDPQIIKDFIKENKLNK